MTSSLSHRFETALIYANELHKDQKRKKSEIPYISHLLAVTAIVLENGGSENQAIAALLHDAVEDQGGCTRLHEIEDLYGAEVARIVEGCTDAFTVPKPDWKPRKIDYLEKLKVADSAILLVSLADKIHNGRSILNDLKKDGNKIWEKFTGKKKGTLWYYRSLVDIFATSPYPDLSTELQQLVNEIEELS